MKKALSTVAVLFLGCIVFAYAAQDLVSAAKGTVKKIDSTSKTIVVETADGTDHTLHFARRTVVHGGTLAGQGATGTFHGLTEGSKVVVHYTVRGSEETAEEVDRIGDDGLKVSTGTISRIDRGGKVLVVKSADGSENTFRLTDHAATDGGKDLVKGSEKSAKVSVYYSEEAGHKVAHFFEASV